MDVHRIVSELDTEIARLQQIRSALTGLTGAPAAAAVAPRRGRPRKNAAVEAKPAKTARKKRELSPEGRKAIADAMKRRWAEHRKKQGDK